MPTIPALRKLWKAASEFKASLATQQDLISKQTSKQVFKFV